MTDSTPYDRRRSDEEYKARSDEIIGRLDTIDDHHSREVRWHSNHLADHHANLEVGEAAVLVDKVRAIPDTIVTDTALLVELVAGEEIIDDFTNEPTGRRLPGIAERVEVLELAANGGRGLSIRTRDKLIIIIANGLIAVVVAGIVASA